MKALAILSLTAVVLMGGDVAAAGETGKAAPAFSLTDIHGKTHTLADFQGKTMVLEWTNYDCPFVKKHYGSGNMQKLQKTYTEKGVIWLSICSSASGKQGHYPAAAWQKKTVEKGSKATAVLLDPDGQVGRAYGAKTTPHIFIIAADGTLRYEGAMDDNPSWNPKTVEGAHNYVAAALDALLAGKAVAVSETKPYGCSVKY